jgi:hypothetical protein
MLVSLVIGDLQQRPRKVGAVALKTFSLCGRTSLPSLEFHDKNSRSDIYWLYLAMFLLKVLF